MNNIMLIGNTGRSAESRATQNGGMVTFSLAVSDRRRNERGEYENIRTDWFDCVMYTNTQEGASRFGNALPAGSKVAVRGEMQSQQYEKEGHKLTSWRVLVRDVEILYTPQAQQAPQAQQSAPAQQPAPQPQQPAPQAEAKQNDLPF